MNDYIDAGEAPDWVGDYAAEVLEDVADAWDVAYAEHLADPLTLQPVPDEAKGSADLEAAVLYLPDPEVVTDEGMRRNVRGEVSHALSAVPVDGRPHATYPDRVVGELFEGMTEVRYEPDQVARYLDRMDTITSMAGGMPSSGENVDGSLEDRRIERVRTIPGVESGHLAGYSLAQDLHGDADHDPARLVRMESNRIWEAVARERAESCHDVYRIGSVDRYADAGI